MKKPIDESARLPWENGLAVEPTTDSLPGVTIVVPIFNSGKFLEKTLRSLLCNNLSGCEVIVMDGGSTDQTPEILRHYADMFSICVSERDKGQSDAINRGFARATKPIYYWLNGDDILLPNALTDVRKYFSEHPECEFLVGNAYMTEMDFRPLRHFVFDRERLKFTHLIDYAPNHLVQPSVFFSRNAWSIAGPVKLDLHYAMDADLFLGMAKNFEGHHLDRDVAYSVYHEDCKTKANRARSITELALVQAHHGSVEYAKKTLDILVDLHEKLESRLSEVENSVQAKEADFESRIGIMKGKFAAMTEEYEKNKRLLLEADIAFSRLQLGTATEEGKA